MNDPNLNNKLSEWQFHYNYFRPHSSLNGKTPIEVACEHSAKAPFWDEVEKAYDPTKERIREQAYWRDKKMKKYTNQQAT